MSVLLPANYQRILSSLTEIMEREALELIRILENPEKEEGIIRISTSFTPQIRQEKTQRLRSLLDENRRFFRELQAEPVLYSEEQIFDAKITQLWTILSDSRPGKMKGYGPLTKEEREWIDEHVGRLLKIINELKR